MMSLNALSISQTIDSKKRKTELNVSWGNKSYHGGELGVVLVNGLWMYKMIIHWRRHDDYGKIQTQIHKRKLFLLILN